MARFCLAGACILQHTHQGTEPDESQGTALHSYLDFDIKQLLMLDINTARHRLGSWVVAFIGAIDLSSCPFGNITLADTHPAVGWAYTPSRGLAADVDPQLLLRLLLALLLVHWPARHIWC